MSGIATAIVGSAVIGGVAANNASKNAAKAQNNATAAASELGSEQLELDRDRFAFEKDQWNAGAGDRQYASEIGRKVGDRQVLSMDQQYQIADDYWNYQKDTFRPLEMGLVQQASEYDTQARRDSEAAKAVSGVQSQMDATQQQQQRSLARMGVNPSSGKFAALANQTSLTGAAAKAGAANKARNDIETKGFAMQMDASGLGRNLATNQTAAANSALSQGNSGVANSQVPIGIANQATNMMSGAYGSMSGALGNSANQVLNIGNIQAKNFYDSQNFGMQMGNNVASSLMTGYGLASGQYKPPGWGG